VVDLRRARLYERLRRRPSASTIPGTLPVLFFGDLFDAKVASVGLNPSDQEYLSKDGTLLTGPAQRFATTNSLGATDRPSLSDEQCSSAIKWMRDYYEPGKPVYGPWFNALSRVIEGFGASFRDRTSAHLDLVQESTSPVWSELDGLEREALLKQDLPFLQWEIRAFPLRLWARANDNEESSFRMTARPDIGHAAEAVKPFPESWWGVVVFTCFGSVRGAKVVAPYFQRPLPPLEAEAMLLGIDFPRGSVGHHRIRPGVKGGKQALLSACADHELFHNVLHTGEDFDTRYSRLREAHVRQWGRTTSFDLLLRTGALGIGGQHYKPEYAYLGGSTGPRAGFTRVWGVSSDADTALVWAEALLRAWTEEWDAVSERVGVEWQKPPLEPCDQENFLCIYQERR
jgi:hypothetical protein